VLCCVKAETDPSHLLRGNLEQRLVADFHKRVRTFVNMLWISAMWSTGHGGKC